MIIMKYGCKQQGPRWQVAESKAPGYLRLYHMMGGSVTYRDDQGEMPLQPGRLYLFPPQRAYRLQQQPLQPIHCLYLHADIFPYVLHHPIEIDPASHPDLADTLSLLQRQVLAGEDNAPCVEAFALGLMQLLIRLGFLSQRIESRLTQGFGPAVRVKDICRQSGYCQEHFIRSFTRAAGVTPYQYILSQRMHEAVALMRQGYPIEEIAGRIGYASGKSFSGAFKRHFGIPPQVYRKHFLQNA